MSERLYSVVMCDLGSDKILERLATDLNKKDAEEFRSNVDRYDREQMYTAFEVDEVGFYAIADCIEDLTLEISR